MTRRVSVAERVYRAGLLIFPLAFRERFADEMTAFAREQLRRARARGLAATCRTAAALAADLVRSAPAQWIAAREHARLIPATSPYPRDNMDTLLQDVRFALRALARRPTFTVVAALTLALGIGATTAIFSVVNAVVLRPLPYSHPDRLVALDGVQGTQGGQGVSYADYVDWRAQTHAFSDMGVWRPMSFTLTGGDTPERILGTYVTASFLRLFDVQAARGRLLTDAETELSTESPVAVISYEAWQSHFGGDPSLVGRVLTLNGTAFTVVGITAAGSLPLLLGTSPPDAIVPIGYYPNAHGLERGTRGVGVFARLAPGVTIAAASRELSAVEQHLAEGYPATNAGTGARVIALRDTIFNPRARATAFIVLAAVLVVLLIACANVANLQLARGAARASELSVRAALGAGRGRIARQLLTESLVLAIVGGTAGVALALLLGKALRAAAASRLAIPPEWIALDGRVLAFAIVVSVATGVLFGLPPALRASRVDLARTLGSRGTAAAAHLTTRNALAIVQLALSLSLLTAAGLLTRSLVALQRVDPGFDADHLLTAQFRLPANKYDTPQKIAAMFDRAIAEIRAIPGVESAALVRSSPLSGNGDQYPAAIEGRASASPADEPSVVVNPVTPGYLATMRIPVVVGRALDATDRAGAQPVVVVSKALADQAWPSESPIGKRIKFGGDDDWRTVVGVAGDARQYSLNETGLLEAYIPHAQRPQIFTSIVARTHGDPTNFVKPLREAIWRVDRDQPVWGIRPMADYLAVSVSTPRATMWLMASFAALALLLATVGIYGVLSYTIAQRSREIGIRVALGAEPRAVVRMVVGDGARLIGVAVLLGLLASLGAGRLMQSQLYGVGPNDLATFAVVTAVLAGVALVACYLPARRASRVDPVKVLRVE